MLAICPKVSIGTDLNHFCLKSITLVFKSSGLWCFVNIFHYCFSSSDCKTLFTKGDWYQPWQCMFVTLTALRQTEAEQEFNTRDLEAGLSYGKTYLQKCLILCKGINTQKIPSLLKIVLVVYTLWKHSGLVHRSDIQTFFQVKSSENCFITPEKSQIKSKPKIIKVT